MPADPTLDFKQIRPHRGDRKLALEELTRQLIVVSPPPGMIRFEHKGPGADGGVESLVYFADGTCWGYQTKFFLDAFGSSELSQVKSSWSKALESYPTLTRYIVGIPRNLSAAMIPGARTERRRWDAWVTKAGEALALEDRTVSIELWDETTYLAKLIPHDPLHAGIRRYWFEAHVLTPAWFTAGFEVVQEDLNARYSAPDHVDVVLQADLDTLTRSEGFPEVVARHDAAHLAAARAFEAVVELVGERVDAVAAQALRLRLAEGRALWLTLSPLEAPPVDIAPLGRAVQSIFDLAHGAALTVLLSSEGDPRADTEAAKMAAHRLNDARWKVDQAVEELRETFEALDVDLLKHPRILVVGEAGSGKSHSLAHMVDRHLAEGLPAVMMLGQYFVAGDPRAQMMSRLGLAGLDFEEFLGAMQAASGATGRPALIVIDAINESQESTLWSANLAGMVAQIRRFDRVVLVLSCRDTYESVCIPDGVSLVRRPHRGFGGDAAAAAKSYLDKHGIDRPAAPFLDSAFTNPLFLSISVRRLRAEGRTSFPLGMEGASELFAFWIDGVEKALVLKGYRRIALGDGRIAQALKHFAEELAIGATDGLPLTQATALFEKAVQDVGLASPNDRLVQRLLDEGVLRRDVGQDGAEDTVSFTFQRFADHFVAAALLDLADTPQALAEAMRPGGDLDYLVAEPRWRFEGVVESLMALAPETLGVELVDLAPGFAAEAKLSISGFLDSLRWRSPSAVSERTVEIFEGLWARPKGRDRDFIDLLFQVSTLPGHRLNADYFHARLSRLPMPERDALLAPYIHHYFDDGPGGTLMEWARDARTDLAEFERVRLAAVVVAWLTFSSTRSLRDRASRTLTALILRSPRLMPILIRTFAGVDDAYVRERVLATVLAAATHLDTEPDVLREAAVEVWRAVFDRPVVEWHAFVRHYARGIVELAAARGVLDPVVDIGRARPPYASTPVLSWPSEADLLPLVDEARAIISSAVGFYSEAEGRFTMQGDFGSKTMSGLSHFYREPRGPTPPRTRGQIVGAYWEGVRAMGGEVARLAEQALDAHRVHAEAESRRVTDLYFGFLDTPATPHAPKPADEAEIETLETLRDAADGAVKVALGLGPDDRLSYPGHGDKNWPSFDRRQGQRWVGLRAVQLGWTQALHEPVEELTGYWGGRDKHETERIGKKYQWIAFHELIGVLQDHYWHEGRDRAPEVLMDLLLVRGLDIDLSFTGVDADRWPKGLPSLGLPRTDMASPASVEAGQAWTFDRSDLPHVQDLVEGLADNGERWWVVHTYRQDDGYMDKLQSDGSLRTCQGAIQLVILGADDIQRLHDRQSAQRVNNVEMGEGGWFHDRMFGQYRAELADGGPGLNSDADDVEYGRVSRRFSPHRGEYDHGGLKEHPSFEIPRAWILDGLGLKPAGPWACWFVDAAGRPGLVDPEGLDRGEAASMINAEMLEPYLRAHGYVAAWTYWGEKDGGMGSGAGFSARYGQFERQTWCALWWREEGVWKGSLWHADGEKLHASIEDGDED